MTSILPIGIQELLSGAVENARLEPKASWDPTTTGGQVLKTLCAFANDLQNLNGGYVVLGVGESNGVAVRPVQGLKQSELDAAQKWIRGNCNRIDPIYMPVIDAPRIDGRHVLVLWAPASDTRPHQAPDGPRGERKYWVRIGSETVEARQELLTRLMQQPARIPFDDRRAFEAVLQDLRIGLTRELLHDVGSDLIHQADPEQVYSAMRITRRQNGHSVPRNIGLLFFNEDPERWFRGARIEVVGFADDAGGDTISENVFRGPLHHQLRNCLTWLETLTTRQIEKQPDAPEARTWVSYPVAAVREAVVNAVYHRSYEDVVEPTKVYLYPNRIEVVSYPGPMDGIELDHLTGSLPLPPVPARNRRIGEFLKELRLAEGRGTGLPKMQRGMRENGSPPPRFDFDAARSYFRVVLPAHPEFVAQSILRDYAYRNATGDASGALRALKLAWEHDQGSASLAATLVRALVERGNLASASEVCDQFPEPSSPTFARVLTLLAAAFLESGEEAAAHQALNRLPDLLTAQDALDAAAAERRAGRHDRAHRYYVAAGDRVLQDARASHEFAQTKLALASRLRPSANRLDRQTRARLLREATFLLERVVGLEAPPARLARAWFDLGRARRSLKRPATELIAAFERAAALVPGEHRYSEALDAARNSPR